MDHTLPTLAKLIDEKTYDLRLMWQGASNNNIQRDDLYEDLHWLLMVAGNFETLLLRSRCHFTLNCFCYVTAGARAVPLNFPMSTC